MTSTSNHLLVRQKVARFDGQVQRVFVLFASAFLSASYTSLLIKYKCILYCNIGCCLVNYFTYENVILPTIPHHSRNNLDMWTFIVNIHYHRFNLIRLKIFRRVFQRKSTWLIQLIDDFSQFMQTCIWTWQYCYSVLVFSVWHICKPISLLVIFMLSKLSCQDMPRRTSTFGWSAARETMKIRRSAI